MWKSPIPQAMTAKQCQKVNRDKSEDAGQSDCKSPSLCCVDFTCLNCVSQTHFASAVEHAFVDPEVECVLSWRRVPCEQQLDTFQSCCQFGGNQVLQTCTCSQLFDLAQVHPFSFPLLCISTLWLSFRALCGPHDPLTRSHRGSRFACMRVSLNIVPSDPHERSTFVTFSSSTSHSMLPIRSTK